MPSPHRVYQKAALRLKLSGSAEQTGGRLACAAGSSNLAGIHCQGMQMVCLQILPSSFKMQLAVVADHLSHNGKQDIHTMCTDGMCMDAVLKAAHQTVQEDRIQGSSTICLVTIDTRVVRPSCPPSPGFWPCTVFNQLFACPV